MPYHDRNELLLDQKSTILPWVESWRRRLMRFAVRQERGRCNIPEAENAFSKSRVNPVSQHRRNLLRQHSTMANASHQSQVMVNPQQQPLPQPRSPRHYYPPESQYTPVNVAPSWNQYQYRSMRHVDGDSHAPISPAIPSSP